MLVKVFRTVRRTITESDENVSIDGIWNPKFYNLGDVDVFINGDKIPADKSGTEEGNPNGESMGNVSVMFDDTQQGIRLVRMIGVVLDHVKEVSATKSC